MRIALPPPPNLYPHPQVCVQTLPQSQSTANNGRERSDQPAPENTRVTVDDVNERLNKMALDYLIHRENREIRPSWAPLENCMIHLHLNSQNWDSLTTGGPRGSPSPTETSFGTSIPNSSNSSIILPPAGQVEWVNRSTTQFRSQNNNRDSRPQSQWPQTKKTRTENNDQRPVFTVAQLKWIWDRLWNWETQDDHDLRKVIMDTRREFIELWPDMCYPLDGRSEYAGPRSNKPYTNEQILFILYHREQSVDWIHTTFAFMARFHTPKLSNQCLQGINYRINTFPVFDVHGSVVEEDGKIVTQVIPLRKRRGPLQAPVYTKEGKINRIQAKTKKGKLSFKKGQPIMVPEMRTVGENTPAGQAIRQALEHYFRLVTRYPAVAKHAEWVHPSHRKLASEIDEERKRRGFILKGAYIKHGEGSAEMDFGAEESGDDSDRDSDDDSVMVDRPDSM